VGGTCGTHGRTGKCTVVWWEREPLGRPRRRWEDEMRMDLRDVDLGGGSGFSWLRTECVAVVNTVMNPRVLASRNFILNEIIALDA
jgi:hypothetical protein